MIYFDQAEEQILAINQFYKRQFLDGNPQVEIQPPLHCMILSLHFFSEKKTDCSITKTASWKWNTWSHSP